MDSRELKRLTGTKAIDTLVHEGMKLGMGTGSTALEAMKRLKQRIKAGEIKELFIVPTSFQTAIECRAMGLPLYDLNDPVIGGNLDLTIDGADEVDPQWNLIKGGGGALLLEKIVGSCSKKYAIIVDESKIVEYLGKTFAVPVEVVPEALTPVINVLKKMGAEPVLRSAVKKAGPVITKSGNFIIDARFDHITEPAGLECSLNNIPGIIENGIFTLNTTDLFIGKNDGTVEYKQKG